MIIFLNIMNIYICIIYIYYKHVINHYFKASYFPRHKNNAPPKLFSLVNWRQLKPGDMLVVHGTKGSKDGKELLEAKWMKMGDVKRQYLGVSKNRGKTPKMDGLEWKTLLKWMIWGYHYFRKHPFICQWWMSSNTFKWGCHFCSISGCQFTIP